MAGVPAKKIKDLDPDRVVRYTTDKEYYGMIPSYEFPEKIRKYLDVTFLKRTFPDELSSH